MGASVSVRGVLNDDCALSTHHSSYMVDAGHVDLVNKAHQRRLIWVFGSTLYFKTVNSALKDRL